jgi:hypothetical protein
MKDISYKPQFSFWHGPTDQRIIVVNVLILLLQLFPLRFLIQIGSMMIKWNCLNQIKFVLALFMSWVELMWSVFPSWCRTPFWGAWPDFSFNFFCRTFALLIVLEGPLWREDGTVICSAIYQWSESRRNHNRTLLSRLGLLGSLLRLAGITVEVF